MAAEIDQLALADASTLLSEEVLSLTGSLNVRRTALSLITLFQPRLADWAILVISDGVTGGLELFGGSDAGFRAVVERDSVAGPGLDRVLRTGRTELRVSADSTDELSGMVPHRALVAEAAELRPVTVLGLGLTARGTTLGALVIARGFGRSFDDDEIAFAEHIAARGALALASARISEERSLIATELLHPVRPRTLPEIPGVRLAASYRPAAEHLDIGGDFYDVHGSGDDWLISLGDVSGKGVEAAVLTDRARQSIRTAAHFDRSPTAVLGALNSVFYDADFDRFVTAIFARMRSAPDGSHAEIELAVAGHQAPIVLRANGRVQRVDVSGIAIGPTPDARYQAAAVRLDRGDAMLMFSDGIDEATVRTGSTAWSG